MGESISKISFLSVFKKNLGAQMVAVYLWGSVVMVLLTALTNLMRSIVKRLQLMISFTKKNILHLIRKLIRQLSQSMLKFCLLTTWMKLKWQLLSSLLWNYAGEHLKSYNTFVIKAQLFDSKQCYLGFKAPFSFSLKNYQVQGLI